MADFKFKERYNIDDLVSIVEVLRSPGGCPWDMEQTHTSIRMDFIEEVYEAIEAIDTDNTELLREELGDVLLQVVFHTQIEREKQSFNLDDVCDEVCKKLIIRHPHVFGEVTVNSMSELLNNWDAIKQETKGQTTFTETLESVAVSLPALMRAQKVGKRAAKCGFDFTSADDAFEKLQSETEELREAIDSGDKAAMEDELGDLLFSCVNTARQMGIDAETALTKATEKFIHRFALVEKAVQANGKTMDSCTLTELDEVWEKIKHK